MTDHITDLLAASQAAVERMQELIGVLERSGCQLLGHTLYLPMVQLEQARQRVIGDLPTVIGDEQ